MPNYYTGNSVIWSDWTTSSCTTSSAYIREGWSSSTITASCTSDYFNVPVYNAELERQKAERQAERERELQEASERAEKLLRDNLSPAQLAEYEKNGWFHVTTAERRYRIRKARSANIDVLKADGAVDHRLCVHPVELVPDADTMLAQKLALETDEAALLNLANRHPAPTPPPPPIPMVA